ncbi:MAG: hypothetical protein ABIK15_11970 [Pseudomonadota bacterium]
MHTEQQQQIPRQGIYKKKTADSNGYDPLSLLLSELIHTREIRTLLAKAVPEVLHAWAGENFAKKITTRAIGKNIRSGLSRPEDTLGQGELAGLFGWPDRIRNITELLPGLLDVFFDIANELGKGLESLPPAEKQKAVGRLLSGMFSGRTGKVITTWAKVISGTQSESPDFVKESIAPGIIKWMENTDFGELKDLLDSIHEISGETIKVMNDAIWKYPSKVVLLVSFLPSMINILIKVINECVGRFNNLAPDLVADVVLSCFRDIDAKHLGQTVNEFAELIRKLDTGSSLIGDSGVSGLNRDLSGFLNDFFASLHMETLFRAREGLAAGKDTLSARMFTILKENPQIVLESISRSQSRYNPAIKSMSRKAALVCDLPEQETAEAFSKTLSQLDCSEMAEIVNLTSLLTNRIRRYNTKLLPSLVSQIIDSLDLVEVEEAASGIINDMGKSMKPLGRVVLPHLITMACDWLSSDENQEEPAMENARQAIQSLLHPKEVPV